ncbi:cytochrome b5 [Galendromus occidentalis]|uniref:Cytochrome b5 n=1 Tax=Galendromus occidentalis TaxID=34638 RepID=A0AAJ6QLP9_9ACAR|nr:cytochrome b5 [Galendromus occidentalis]
MHNSKMSTYSLEEVAKHNKRSSCWLVIREGIYDVTNFMKEHPGGEELMFEQGGRDSTELFYAIGHSTDARMLMAKLKIGELCDEDKAKIKGTAGKSDSLNATPFKGGVSAWIYPIAIAIGAALLYFSPMPQGPN